MATTEQENSFYAIVAEAMPASVNRLEPSSDLWSFFMSLADKGSWGERSGWLWSNRSTTIRMAESLVKRGLAVKSGSGYILSTDASGLWRPFRQEADRQESDRRKQRQLEHDLQWQDRHAREYAIGKLIEAHQDEFDAWRSWYIDLHPVQS